MRGYIHTVRPAGAAIAAVLALGSTIAGAQEAPAISSPIVVPPPVVTSPAPMTAEPFAAPAQPMVQQTPSVEERLAAARAASEAESATSAPAIAPRRTEAPARRAQATAQASVASRTADAPPVSTAQPSAPLAQARVAAPTAPADVSASAPQPMAVATPQDSAARADNSADPALLWAAGGGILVLAGLGGMAMMRRRKRPLENRVEDREEWVSVAAESRAADLPAAPVAVERSPRPATAHRVVTSGAGATLADMVAAPPSADNPFRTQKRRLARARFLLAQQGRQSARLHSGAEPSPPPQTIHAEPQMQTVYRLGSSQGSRMGYKPQTR